MQRDTSGEPANTKAGRLQAEQRWSFQTPVEPTQLSRSALWDQF